MIKKLLGDTFIKNNIIFFIGSLIAAFLNYLYHPIMVRMMSVKEFGEVETIISITYLMGIFLMICGTVAINIVSNHLHASSTKYIQLLAQLFKLVLPIVLLYAMGIVIFSPILMHFLHFDSILPFLPLALILSVDVVSTFYNAYLRGAERFFVVSIANIISSGGRVIFGIILVYAGLQVFGAIGALAVANLVSLLYVMHKTRGLFHLAFDEKAIYTAEICNEISYSVLIFFSLGYITFLYASDVLFIKYYFDPETAGLYSGIVTIARIIFFATGSVAGVLMPTIKIRAQKRENRTILKKALCITILISIGILGAFTLFPSWIVSVMLGERYVALAHLLPLAGVYAFSVSLVNVVYTYYIALRDRRLIYISLIGLVMTLSSILLYHHSAQAVIGGYIFGTSVTGVLLLMFKICNCCDACDKFR